MSSEATSEDSSDEFTAAEESVQQLPCVQLGKQPFSPPPNFTLKPSFSTDLSKSALKNKQLWLVQVPHNVPKDVLKKVKPNPGMAIPLTSKKDGSNWTSACIHKEDERTVLLGTRNGFDIAQDLCGVIQLHKSFPRVIDDHEEMEMVELEEHSPRKKKKRKSKS